MDVALTRELLAVASTGLLCLRWLGENAGCRGSEGLGRKDGSGRTLDFVARPGMPEFPTAATCGTCPRSGDQQTEGNPAGDAGAASCDSIYVHRCRGAGGLDVNFIPAASCGFHSNGGDAHSLHSISGTTLKVMRRRGGLRTNFGASRRRIYRLVVPSLVVGNPGMPGFRRAWKTRSI